MAAAKKKKQQGKTIDAGAVARGYLTGGIGGAARAFGRQFSQPASTPRASIADTLAVERRRAIYQDVKRGGSLAGAVKRNTYAGDPNYTRRLGNAYRLEGSVRRQAARAKTAGMRGDYNRVVGRKRG